MQELQWDRAKRAMAESARLVAESDLLRKDVARTVVQTSELMIGLIQATPKSHKLKSRARRAARARSSVSV
jgi:hypothetical protein